MVFLHFQAKRNNSFEGSFTSDTFTHQNLSEGVRGQHGIELVLQMHESFFRPGIVGVIVIGTQVALTFTSHRSAELMQCC